MHKIGWLIAVTLILLTACQSAQVPVTLLDGGHAVQLVTSERVPARLLAAARIDLGKNDRVIFLGAAVPLDQPLPGSGTIALTVRRSVAVTVHTPSGEKTFQSSALTVGQALQENGYTLFASDRIDPPAETPLTGPLTVGFQPAGEFLVHVDGSQVHIHSAAATVGQALAEAGMPLVGLDYSLPAENSPLPTDGQIRIVRVVESVALTPKSIPYQTTTQASADLELDQQAILQAGSPGLSIARMRTRSEDGQQVSQVSEGESLIRPAQDRVLGFGTKIVIRTAVVDGVTIQYYRAVRLMTTSYSPCRSASPDGRCLNGTSSGLPVKHGTVAMVYSWYLAFGFDQLYIPGYGYATVGDVGAGCPPAAGCPNKHYWVDLAWTDADYQPMSGWTTVYFLAPPPANPVYILP